MAVRSGWGQRLGSWTVALAVIALLTAGLGLTLARYDAIGKLAGFSAFLLGGLLAALALILGLVALVAGRKRGLAPRGKLFAAIGVALAYVAFLATRPMAAGDSPSIHDVTTDLANPPRFETLKLREDNLTGVGTIENWRRIHAGAYRDLAPVTIAKPVAEVTRDAARLAEASGWEVAASDPAAGRVEATDSVSYIRFQDDVVIRIVATPDGARSVVDMRSVSRVGGGDLGVNARRIRKFLAALAAA